MRPQRNKQFDWSKPFKLIEDRKQFQQIETGQDLVISIQNKQPQAPTASYKKQNIITPKIQTVPRITSVKPFAKINPNYIRLTQRLNLPRLIDYELTQVDHMFVKTHAQKYKFKNKIILTTEFLSKVFIQLQLKAGKDPTIPRNKGWMIFYLQRQHKQLIDWQSLQNFASLVYNFWKNRRQDLKFPLLRPLWRPNPDQFNHLLAFKPRQKQKRNLRKTTRISQDQILAQLHDQFQIAKQITQRVQLRQQLRFKHLHSQLAIFHNQCKLLFGIPEFLGEFLHQTRPKDKQKIKHFHQKLDRLKARRQQPIQPQVVPIVTQQLIYDQKLSVINFLSTVINQADAFGINYSSIFQSKSQPIPIIQQIIVQKQEQPAKDQPYVNMNLQKAGDMIIRNFQVYSQESQQQNKNQMVNLAPKRCYQDIIDFYKTRISTHYIGQDDQFQGKDLRKNIAASFKKFQSQYRQM